MTDLGPGDAVSVQRILTASHVTLEAARWPGFWEDIQRAHIGYTMRVSLGPHASTSAKPLELVESRAAKLLAALADPKADEHLRFHQGFDQVVEQLGNLRAAALAEVDRLARLQAELMALGQNASPAKTALMTDLAGIGRKWLGLEPDLRSRDADLLGPFAAFAEATLAELSMEPMGPEAIRRHFQPRGGSTRHTPTD